MSEINVPQMLWPRNMNELPKEMFVREDIFNLERERIFRGAEWHAVAHASEVPAAGDFKTFDVGGVPLLIVHSVDGVIRVFYNSCAHRGNQIETETFGNRKTFQCPYHRWTFGSDGKLIGCPNSDQYSPGFSRDNYPLNSPRTARFCDLIFITMSQDTPPLEDWLGPVKDTIREALGDSPLRLLGYQKVSFKANWKALSDNDGYHAPLLHKAFAMLKWQGGKGRQFMDMNRGHIGYEGEIKPVGQTSLVKDASIISFRESDPFKGASRIVNLFPVTGIVKHLDIINIRFTIAVNVEDTECHFVYFAKADDDESMVRQRIRQSSNLLGPCGMVSMEDASIFHRIHIGSHTPGNAIFQKGVRSVDRLESEVGQNDESGNLARWEYYRKLMGFARSAV
ncbi:MAG: aromatic ring-hydroxylating dioxygenase subunit alpha [Sinimarinibacterium sp.]|jgi:phenylpropionate dioxygenase-like ring-hydroxylating dioxygenase large terminal subunit